MRRFQTADARTLSYRTVGVGPLVVMLPGGPGLDPPTFFGDVELRGFTQLVFCPRGTGESDPPDEPDGYRIAGYVDDLEELRKHLGLAQLTLYGSSHGASTCLAYAVAYPEQVDRMILASAPARLDGDFQQALTRARERYRTSVPNGTDRLEAADAAGPRMRSASSDDDRRKAMRAMIDVYVAHKAPIETGFLDRLNAAPMNFAALGPMAAEMMSGLDLLEDAGKIRARTLVLTGELDVRVPAEHMQEIAEAIPEAHLITFPNIGHLIHVEACGQWAQTVSDFLRKN